MVQVLLVIHLLIAIAMVGVVLLQRSEGGGLGIGGGGAGGGGMGGFLTGRGTSNLLTRTTAILAACFMATSLTLTIIASGSSERRSIIDDLPTAAAERAAGAGGALRAQRAGPVTDRVGQPPARLQRFPRALRHIFVTARRSRLTRNSQGRFFRPSAGSGFQGACRLA